MRFFLFLAMVRVDAWNAPTSTVPLSPLLPASHRRRAATRRATDRDPMHLGRSIRTRPHRHGMSLSSPSPPAPSADIPDPAPTIARVAASASHYDTLGVARNATAASLKKSYRRLALQLHPDVCAAEGGADAFQKVSGAYATLSEPNAREHYDRTGGEIPAGGVVQRVDPNEFFRDFMAQNPAYKEIFTNQSFSSDGRLTIDLASAFRRSWEIRAAKLPAPLRPPFRLLGTGLFRTMPYSGAAITLLAVAAGAKWARWSFPRATWIIAGGILPWGVGARFKIWMRVAVIVAGERAGVSWGFRRGAAALAAVTVLNRVVSPAPTRAVGNPFASVRNSAQAARQAEYLSKLRKLAELENRKSTLFQNK